MAAAAAAAAVVRPTLTSSSPSPKLYFRKYHSVGTTAASTILLPPRSAAIALSFPSSAGTPLPVTRPICSCRLLSLVAFAVPRDDATPSNAGFEGESNVPDAGAGTSSEEAWQKVLESFKANALQMKNVSQEAYEVYSKRAIVILEETSKALMIQADKSSRDISAIAQEVGEEGWEYISAATENSPEPVRDVVEAFSKTPADFRDVSKVQDFHVGIPYGAFLAAEGFLSFMFTGSTAAIRFGIILGGALLALSVSSLKEWKKGKTSSLLLKGQAAIAAILFVREWRLLLQRPSLPSSVITISSGAVLLFYIYKIIIYRQSKDKSFGQGSDASDV